MIPDLFIRVQLRRVWWNKLQNDLFLLFDKILRLFAVVIPCIVGVRLLYESGFMTNLEINYPAASSGVLEQRQLMVIVQLLIIFTLILYITAYHLFISMLTNRTCKISISPKLSSP